jgi:PAS domain-containing protein
MRTIGRNKMNDTRPDRKRGDTPIVDHELNEQAREQTAALRESEERYRAIIEASPISIVTLRAGRFVAVNPAACRTLGFSDPQGIVGRPVIKVVGIKGERRHM